MKRTTQFLFMLSFALISNAAEVWHTSTVKTVYPLSNGGFVLTFTTDQPSCTSNASPDYYYVLPGVNGVTVDGANKIYSLALAAASQKLPLTIAFDNANSDCAVNRALVQFSN